MKTLLLLLGVFMNLYGIMAQQTNIPDSNFEQALINLGYDTAPVDGVVLTANINTIDSLNVNSSFIHSLVGIEDFTALEILQCNGNYNLQNINISQNLKLTTLRCTSAPITSLNVTQNSKLTTLNCGFSSLTTIDVTQNPLLSALDCSNNSITSLDVTQNSALTLLSCGGNQITNLDVTQNTLLQSLNCSSNNFNELDISQNTMLHTFNCAGTPMSQLNAKSGNNTNIVNFNTLSNPNLGCIQVDNVAYSTANWTLIDPTSSFGTDCFVGIDKANTAVTINVYPNPTQAFINLVLEKEHHIAKITLYDMAGKVAKIYDATERMLDVKNINSGQYILHLQTDEGIITKKVQVE